jgi:DNA-binding CsgD family transcriptional regulator
LVNFDESDSRFISLKKPGKKGRHKFYRKTVMVRNELIRFIKLNEEYMDMCGELPDTLDLNENTVAAFTRCGIETGTAFLSRNFTRVFGYSRKHFIEGDLKFLMKHIHPDDLQAFIYFAETSTLNAAPWKEAKEGPVHECCSRFKHFNGEWIWISQKVIVLSVTPEQHIDHVLLLFDDCTAAKEARLTQHTLQVEKSRKSSKLLELIAPVSGAQVKKEARIAANEGYAPLTRREKEIMLLVSQGCSSKEIACRLFISKHTVESHRKHILHKLSVKNSPEMVHQSMMAPGGECL